MRKTTPPAAGRQIRRRSFLATTASLGSACLCSFPPNLAAAALLPADNTADKQGDKAARRKELYGLLGDLPPRDRPIKAEKVSEEKSDAGYVLETLRLDLNGAEDVPAYFVRPAGGTGPFPTILYNHAHGENVGKKELVARRKGIQDPPYAVELTRRGYAALCIDAWSHGQRATRPEESIFKRALWEGRVLWGMMVYDSLRALDYLASRPDVDPKRLGTMGISMGSTMAWWLAALDERVKVACDLCCLSDYQALLETGGYDGHGIYYFVPGLLKHFTTAQINALTAPRPHLALAGDRDPLTPPQGLDRLDTALKKAYAAEGAAEAWRLFRQDVGHEETPQMRGEVVKWLERWL